MKLLKQIRDTDFGMEITAPAKYKERKTARAVLFDADGNIALLHAAKVGYHCIPGGAIDEGEDIHTGLAREVREEAGCAMQNIRELGIVEEYRNKHGVVNISYCFIADVSGEKGETEFIDDEIEEGYVLEWMSLENAIKAVEGDTGAGNYKYPFIRERELALLKEVAKVLAGRSG